MPKLPLLLILLASCAQISVAADQAVNPGKGAAAVKAQDVPAINLDIGTPPVIITKHALAQRQSRLVRFYESGEIGLGDDGLLYTRDAEKMKLAKRQIAEKLIDAENAERKTLVFAVADGNGRRDAQDEVWKLMRARWNEQFKSGWWLRDANGNWRQKP